MTTWIAQLINVTRSIYLAYSFVDPFPSRLCPTVSLFDCHTSNPYAHIRLGNLPGANHAARFHEIKFILRKLPGAFIRPFVFIAPRRAVYHRHAAATPVPFLSRQGMHIQCRTVAYRRAAIAIIQRGPLDKFL
jgi:hypothetical protein